MANKVYTLAEMSNPEVQSLYSDLYKSIYNVRPHGVHNPQEMLDFINNYDSLFEQTQAELDDELVELGQRYGRQFNSWADLDAFMMAEGI